MSIFLIGHRGVGKTSLLQRYQIYGRGGFPVFDLDREIEKCEKKTVAEIFREQGEASFREIEIRVLRSLIENNKLMVCSLGAGFPLDEFVFPPDSEIIWVRRGSDSVGRIFLDRPRLEQDLSALQEYQKRFGLREMIYSRHSDLTYLLPEGLTSPDENERRILAGRFVGLGGVLTLRSEHFRNPRLFLERIAKMEVNFFELRSDYLSDAELLFALEALPKQKQLLAVRSLLNQTWREALAHVAEVDFPLEGGQIPESATIVSLHERLDEDASWAQALDRLQKEAGGRHLKWSPLLDTFSELEAALRWQAEDSQNRSFLPRSLDGRWSWVRLWLKGRQKINFFRDGVGSAADQPTLYEWLRAPQAVQKFAAVLGFPVEHSFSPLEHSEFFHKRAAEIFRISLKEEELEQGLELLTSMGLCWGAVTSPLKLGAVNICSKLSDEANDLKSVNTLTRLPSGEWRGHNTDLVGLQEYLQGCLPEGPVVVWGGGGTLSVVKKLRPEVSCYSVRTGQPRDGEKMQEDISALIWAASPEAEPPHLGWRPTCVLDLNYREDSKAREYALVVGAKYFSGLYMFRVQASAQQEEWAAYEE